MQYAGGQYGGRDYSGQHLYEYYQQQPQPIQHRSQNQSYEGYQQQRQPIQDQPQTMQSYEGYRQQRQPIQDQPQTMQSYEGHRQQPQPTRDQPQTMQSYEGHRQQPQPTRDQPQTMQSYEGHRQQPQPIQDQPQTMQSYEGHRQQRQPIQRQYSGQQQQYVSTPHTATVPTPQPSPYAAPAVLQPAPPQQPVHPPLSRMQTPHPGANESRRPPNSNRTKSLRSAMKDPNDTSLAASTLRQRRQSGGAEIRPRMETLTRTRTNSSTRVDPDHVFMSINPPNGLELSNLAHKSTVDELREQIFLTWPWGVAHQERDGYDWHIKFVGSPWDSKGPESIRAQRVICRIFWVLASQGYVYLTSVNTGRAFKTPRLVFIRAPADTRAHFFAMSINKAGDRVTFVDPPPAVINSLGLSLRTAFPHQIVNEHTPRDSTFTIELESSIDAMGADKNLFMGHILKYINDMAFKLDASVPLSRRGLFGMSGRKEIWVFKGSESWWSSRKRWMASLA